MYYVNKDLKMNKFQTPGKTKLIKGTILAPENAGLRFVLSVANLAGKAENPLYPIFDKKWKKVKEEVKGWFATKTGAYKLGAVNTIAVQSDTWVLNMLCQNEDLKIDSDSLVECLKKVCSMAKYEHATVHVSTLLLELEPNFGNLISEHLINNGISVFFYEETV